MILWQNTLQDRYGNVSVGAQVVVRYDATGELAPIYRDEAGTDPYPGSVVTANENGFIFFYADNGVYRVTSETPALDWRKIELMSVADAVAYVERKVGEEIPSQPWILENIGPSAKAFELKGLDGNRLVLPAEQFDKPGSSFRLELDLLMQWQANVNMDISISFDDPVTGASLFRSDIISKPGPATLPGALSGAAVVRIVTREGVAIRYKTSEFAGSQGTSPSSDTNPPKGQDYAVSLWSAKRNTNNLIAVWAYRVFFTPAK